MSLALRSREWIRAAIGAASGVFLTALVPVYTAPFGGCDASGFSTLQAGCSNWPEFLRGFVFVLCCALAPRRFRLALVATSILFVVAALGGVAAIKAGSTGDYPTTVVAFLAGYPVFFGGLVGYGLYSFLTRKAGGKRAAA